MFIVDLSCAAGHRFEGWYDDAREYQLLKESHEITCPLCGTHEVERVPSATRISTATTRGEKRDAGPVQAPAEAPPPSAHVAMPLPMQKALAKILDHVRRTTEYVGEEFAERAIRMHRGEEEPRPIHGDASPEEEQLLDEEGVPYLKVPVPDIEKN